MQRSGGLIVYIDGFCLYNMVKSRYVDLKWLDIRGLCEALFPTETLLAVKYFSAELHHDDEDRWLLRRQRAYLDALKATGVELTMGYFQPRTEPRVNHPKSLDDNGLPVVTNVRWFEEKLTDVALATAMIIDSFESAADSFAVLTNDSDFAPAIAALTSRGHKVTLISALGEATNRRLRESGVAATLMLDEGLLRSNQLPESVARDGMPNVRKPSSWPSKIEVSEN